MKHDPASHIAILGAGSWGTAVAMHLARGGHRVCLYGKDTAHIQEMSHSHCNTRYLPDIVFPPHLFVSSDLEKTIANAKHIIIAVPSHAFASILHQLPKPQTGISWLTKGIDFKTHQFLSEMVAKHWGDNYPMAMITGPSFAKEVARQLPTALVIASHQIEYARTLRQVFHHSMVRVYLSEDLIGVQCCGAIKNILAIACGISDGLGFGANAKAALMTRGLAEMSRFGLAWGAQQSTFMGLAGVGDLTLTCTDDQSRNRRFGLHLGQGTNADQAIHQIGQVVEGLHNASQIKIMAEKKQIDMPICKAVWHVLNGQLSPQDAVLQLMQRPLRDEESDFLL